MKALILTVLLFTTGLSANASTNRQLDGQTISNNGAILTLPTTTDTVVGRATTDTLTNKTLTAPVITSPTGIVAGDVGLGNVSNTSDATKNSATATLTNKTIDGGSNTFTNVPAATALSGAVPIANGGTGQTSASGAINALLPSQTSASGQYLTTNGTAASWAAIPSAAPALTGTQASPSAITAAGGVTLSSPGYSNVAFISGSGGPVTVSAATQVSGCSSGLAGARTIIVGESATNTVTLVDGSGLSLNGKWVGGLNSSLNLLCDGTTWVEVARR